MNFVSATVRNHREEIKRGETKKSAARRRWSVLVFVIGAMIGMALVGVSVYADFESSLFDIAIDSEGTIRPIYCPVFLDDTETGQVGATFTNHTDKADEVLVRTHISKGHLIWMREEENRLELAPGQSQRLYWDVTPDDAAYGHLIMAKIIVMGSLSDPKDKGSCGVVVLNLPGEMTGSQFFWLLFSTAFIFLVLGIWLWWPFGRVYTGRRLEATRSMVGLSILITVGLISTSVGLWEMAAVSFYISVLMIGVVVPHFLITRGANSYDESS